MRMVRRSESDVDTVIAANWACGRGEMSDEAEDWMDKVEREENWGHRCCVCWLPVCQPFLLLPESLRASAGLAACRQSTGDVLHDHLAAIHRLERQTHGSPASVVLSALPASLGVRPRVCQCRLGCSFASKHSAPRITRQAVLQCMGLHIIGVSSAVLALH